MWLFDTRDGDTDGTGDKCSFPYESVSQGILLVLLKTVTVSTAMVVPFPLLKLTKFCAEDMGVVVHRPDLHPAHHHHPHYLGLHGQSSLPLQVRGAAGGVATVSFSVLLKV